MRMPYRNQRAATVAYLVAGLVGADTAAKPNIFFYLADDLSKWDVDHQVVPTPTINAFREEAVELTQMHTPMALCGFIRSQGEADGEIDRKFTKVIAENKANGIDI